jgi:DNA-binding MurR/RpiR family transcriptional regulator
MPAEHATDTTGSPAARRERLTSPAERKVADYLIVAGARAAAMSAQEIARAVGTSDATVVRTAKSLGYRSLRDLRHALADDNDDSELSTRLSATIAGRPAAHDVLAGAAQRQLQALESMLRRVSGDDFDRATETLTAATRIWWCGTGPSAFLAGYGAFLCRRLGTPAGTLTHAGADHADELLALRDGDAAVVLAYGRVHPYVHVLLDHATATGVDIILVTDIRGPRLHTPVAVQLNAGRGTPGLFASHGTTIVLVEALVLAIAAHDPGRATEALASLNELRHGLTGRRFDVDPD